MRTLRFTTASDREHRLMFDAEPAAPEAPPPAPAATPAEAPAAPVEGPDAANAAAADGVNAAGAAVAGAVDNAVPPNIPVQPQDVPRPAIEQLRSSLNELGNVRVWANPSYQQMYEKGNLPGIMAAIRNNTDRASKTPGATNRRVSTDRANELQKAAEFLQMGKPWSDYVAYMQRPTQDATQAPQQANAPQRGPAAPAGSPPEAGGNLPPPTPEQALANAELALNEPRASNDEKAGAALDMLDATRTQLVSMGADLASTSPDRASRQQQERLMKDLLDNGGGIDGYIANLENTFNTGEKKDLEGRISDASAEKIQTEGELARLRTELVTEKSEPNNDAKIQELEAAIQRTQTKQQENSNKLATLKQRLNKVGGQLDSDIQMLKTMKKSINDIARSANEHIQTAAVNLKPSTSADNQRIGNALDNVSIPDDPGGLRVESLALGVDNIFMIEKFRDPKVLTSPPRLLAALDAAVKKEKGTTA